MVSSANGVINNKVGADISGVTNTFTVTNPSNTASSAARETITVGGGTAADPSLNFNVSGVTDWEVGIDNSDSDKWKLSQGTALGTNDTIVSDTTGHITFPRTSGFLAWRNGSVANVTGDGTSYTVPFNTEVFDINNDYNPGPGVGAGTFTAPITGHYQFHSTVLSANIVVGYTYGNIQIYINGGATRYLSFTGSPFNCRDTNTNLYAVPISLLVSMTAGDTATIQLAIGGGPKNVTLDGGNAQATFFSGMLAF